MRLEDIKFRAKRLDNNQWVEGYFYQECGNTYIIEDRQNKSELNRNHTYMVDPSTVCKYTGLKDSEGNELFEHDLIQVSSVICEIVWREDFGGFFISEIEFASFGNVPLGEMLSDLKYKRIGSKFDEEV